MCEVIAKGAKDFVLGEGRKKYFSEVEQVMGEDK